MSSDFSAEFAHLRAAIAADLPDWFEIRLIYQLLDQVSSFERRSGEPSARDIGRAHKLRSALERAGGDFTNLDEPGVKLRR